MQTDISPLSDDDLKLLELIDGFEGKQGSKGGISKVLNPEMSNLFRECAATLEFFAAPKGHIFHLSGNDVLDTLSAQKSSLISREAGDLLGATVSVTGWTNLLILRKCKSIGEQHGSLAATLALAPFGGCVIQTVQGAGNNSVSHKTRGCVHATFVRRRCEETARSS